MSRPVTATVRRHNQTVIESIRDHIGMVRAKSGINKGAASDGQANTVLRPLPRCLCIVAIIALYSIGNTHAAEQPALLVAPFEESIAVQRRAEWSRSLATPETLTDGIGMTFILVPPGEFTMGSPENEYRRFGDESLHQVAIMKPFYLSRFETTRGQFARFVRETGFLTEAEKGVEFTASNIKYGTGAFAFDSAKGRVFGPDYSWKNVGFEQTDEHPVLNVSWNDAQEYCRWLAAKEAANYRLPTEAEWEYACRAGTTTQYYIGDDIANLTQVANLADASAKKVYPSDWKWELIYESSDGYAFTAPVGKFRPNAFGIFDMHGNALEWCHDWYQADYLKLSSAVDPRGPSTGSYRAYRGGGWNSGTAWVRSADRSWGPPAKRWHALGFRVVRSIGP